MLSCLEATRVCSDEMDRPLKLGEQFALQAHLMLCRGCTNYRRQQKTLRQVMQAYAQGKAVTTEPQDDRPAD